MKTLVVLVLVMWITIAGCATQRAQSSATSACDEVLSSGEQESARTQIVDAQGLGATYEDSINYWTDVCQDRAGQEEECVGCYTEIIDDVYGG